MAVPSCIEEQRLQVLTSPPGSISSAASSAGEDDEEQLREVVCSSIQDICAPQQYISMVCFRWSGCGWKFANLRLLGAHIAQFHAGRRELSTGDGLFYCRWQGCDRTHRAFNARYKMLVHVRKHTNEKPHTCSKCNKSFSRSENLKIHYRSHTGERPYLCGVAGCNKSYSNSSDRFKHARTHLEQRPYACRVEGCGKRYTDPSSLRKHLKTSVTFHRNLRRGGGITVNQVQDQGQQRPPRRVDCGVGVIDTSEPLDLSLRRACSISS